MRNVPPSSKMHFSMGGWLLGRLATNGRAAALLGASFAGAAVTRSRGCEHLPRRIAPIPDALGTDRLFRFFCPIAVSLPFAESLLQANSFECLGKSLVPRLRELEGEATQPMYGAVSKSCEGGRISCPFSWRIAFHCETAMHPSASQRLAHQPLLEMRNGKEECYFLGPSKYMTSTLKK